MVSWQSNNVPNRAAGFCPRRGELLPLRKKLGLPRDCEGFATATSWRIRSLVAWSTAASAALAKVSARRQALGPGMRRLRLIRGIHTQTLTLRSGPWTFSAPGRVRSWRGRSTSVALGVSGAATRATGP